MAAESCKAYIYNNRKRIDSYFRKGSKPELINKLMQEAMQTACSKVYHEAAKHNRYKGMSSTMTALLILNSKAFLAHVGDSRLYLLRGSEVYQVTDDHTLGNEMLDRDHMDKAEVMEKKYNHILSRSIGQQERTRVDTLNFDILPEDRFLMCTDGLYNYIRSPYELLHLTKGNSQEALNNLINFALKRGGGDNISTILVESHLEESHYIDFKESKNEILNDFALLREIYLFKQLNFSRFTRILNVCKYIDFEKGQIIAEAGSNPQGLYIVVKGRIESINEPKHFYEKGQYFGEFSLALEYKLKDTLRAAEKSKLLFISQEKYRHLCHNHPRFGLRLLTNFLSKCSPQLLQ